MRIRFTTQRTSHPQHSQVAELVDAMDGYSTMCKKAYSVCGHYNGSTTTGSSPVLTTKNKRMKKQFVKDLPIYLNGFAVGMLFFRSGVSSTNVVAYALAMITFFWYGKINK